MRQDYGLFPWLSVRENIAYGPSRKKLPKAEVAGALHAVGFIQALLGGVRGMSRDQRGFISKSPRELLTTTSTALGV